MTGNLSIMTCTRSLLATYLLLCTGLLLLCSTEAEATRFLTPLKVQTPTVELTSPQMTDVPIRWSVLSTGGVPPFSYRYFLDSGSDKRGTLASESHHSYWDWAAQKAGQYRVRVQIVDDRGMLVDSDWSEPVKIIPALRVSAPDSVLAPPVTSRMSVPLTTTVQGGQSPYTYTFQWRQSGMEATEEIGTSGPNWTWQPAEAGTYQLRAIVTDSLGNQVASDWSPVWQVNPLFQVLSITPDRLPAIADPGAEVVWTTRIEGGVGDNQFQFALYRDDQLIQESTATTAPQWRVTGWPDGLYRVQLRVADGFGNQVEGWSETYRIGIKTVAILPVYNLGSTPVPTGMLLNSIEQQMRRIGFEPLSAERLEDFMAEYRWRHTAYLPEAMAAGLREQLQVDAVLLTGVLAYQETAPPQLSLVARLVGTGVDLPIIWADGIAPHGDANPGFLGLGRITGIEPLQNEAVRSLLDKMVTRLQTEEHNLSRESVTVALFPFYNHTEQDRGGETLAAQMLISLIKQPGIRVLEPGLVRDRLLHYRIIAPYGPSEADLSLLQTRLDADLLISGSLTHYHQSTLDPVRIPPETGFSIKVIDLQTQEQVAQDSVFGKGDDRVYFYDFLRIWTAYDLTDHLLNKMLRRWIRSHG